MSSQTQNGVESRRPLKQPQGPARQHHKHGGWSDSKDGSISYSTRGVVLVPTFLLVVCPFFAMVMVHTMVRLDGQVVNLVDSIRRDGFIGLFYQVWLPYLFGSAAAWKLIAPFAIFQLILMRVLPGKLTKGPVTPAGNTPIYKTPLVPRHGHLFPDGHLRLEDLGPRRCLRPPP